MPKLKVEGRKRPSFEGLDLAALAKEYKKFEAKKKKAKDDEEFFSSLVHEIAVKYMPPIMEKLETDDYAVKDVGRIELSTELYISVKKEDKDAFYNALRASGNGALIEDYIFPKRLQAWAKEEYVNGRTVPEQGTITLIPIAKVLKARKKKHGKI